MPENDILIRRSRIIIRLLDPGEVVRHAATAKVGDQAKSRAYLKMDRWLMAIKALLAAVGVVLNISNGQIDELHWVLVLID